MKVLHVARRFTPTAWGGTEAVVASLAREQLRRGDTPTVLATGALDRPGPDRVLDLEVERFPYTYARVPLSDAARSALDHKGGNPLSWRMLLRMLRAPGIDLIHCHTMQRLAGQVRFAARRRGIPYVVHLHGGGFDVPSSEVEEMLRPTRRTWDWGRAPSALLGTRRFLADADLVLALSREEVARARTRLPGTRVELLPNGVDPAWLAAGDRTRGRRTADVPDGAPLALTVARVDPQKGQELIPPVLAATPGLHAVIAGPTTVAGYDRRVTEIARGAGVADRLHMVGPVPPESAQLADLYAAADLLLLPSRHEPFGIVALEAWAAGLPVVATAVGGLADLVRPDVDGYLAAPGDVETLVAAVATVISNTVIARRLGDAGRDRVLAELSWRAVADQLDSLYRSLRGER